MNDDQIKMTAALCLDGSCHQTVLNLPQTEAIKLYQSVTGLKGETVNYADYGEFWAVSFSITLGLYLLSNVIGIMLNIIKRA